MSDKSYVSRCKKFFLFFLNVIIWFGAVGLVAVCAYVLVQKEKLVSDVLDFFLDPASILTLAGSIAIALTLFGCIGSLRENTCLLATYHWILTIFLILELAAGILFVVIFFVPDAQKTLKLYPEAPLKNAIIKYRDDADLEDLINTIQKNLKCCGVSNDDKGYLDWNNNVYFHCNASNISPESCDVPFSCCNREKIDISMINKECGGDAQQMQPSELKGVIYMRGCLKAITQWISDNAILVGGVALGVILPQMIFIYLARGLASEIQQQRLRSRMRGRGT